MDPTASNRIDLKESIPTGKMTDYFVLVIKVGITKHCQVEEILQLQQFVRIQKHKLRRKKVRE